jgi:hypothetical protein
MAAVVGRSTVMRKVVEGKDSGRVVRTTELTKNVTAEDTAHAMSPAGRE